MNKYIKMGLICCAIGMLSTSCNVMDTEPFESYSEDLVWNSKATADAFVFETYNQVIGAYTSRLNPEGWTLNSAHSDLTSSDNFSRDIIDRYYDAGFNKFASLRRCNLIIEKSIASTGLTEKQKTELEAEGRLLRAMIYYDQTRTMGRFIPINKVLSSIDEEAFKTPLTKSIEESYKLVLEDIDAAILGLPETSESGRINRWTAYALKSEVCLTAAAYTGDKSYFDKSLDASNKIINSGKFNIDGNYADMFLEAGKNSGEIIFAQYKLAVNTTVGGTDMQVLVPNVSYDDLVKNGCSPIFNDANGRTFEGWAAYFPTQDLVDQYLVIDEQDGQAKHWSQTSQFKQNVTDDLSNVKVGSFISEIVNIPNEDDMGETSKGPKIVKAGRITADNKDVSSLMYQNRDKRFYGTIVYDSCNWLNEFVTTKCKGNLWAACRASGNPQADSWYTTATGYYWRKAIYNVLPRVYVSNKTDYHTVIYRLGRIYMNKAEALLMKGQVADAVAALNETRVKHGGITPSTAASLADAWTDYKRERRVEMAQEGDYYWSLLRWGKYGGEANAGKPAGDVIEDLTTPVHKIQISQDRKRFFIGQVITNFCWDRNFSTRRYLLPIPQGQRDKRSASGINDEQNPGW